MKNYTQVNKTKFGELEQTSHKRQEKILRDFKGVLHQLLFLFRESMQVETGYLYWINRSRRQFVLEVSSTAIEEIRFQDRIEFDDHFLKEYKDIRKPVRLAVDKDVDLSVLGHYYENVPVKYVTLVPFVNNDESVAIAVLESTRGMADLKHNKAIEAFTDSLRKLLNTYLEITDLYNDQQTWVEYEKSLSFLDMSGHSAALITEMLQTLQSFLQQGSVSFIARGMGTWVNVLHSVDAYRPLPLGIPLEKQSLAWKALNKGTSEFAIHFNKNPKCVSPREPDTEGASFAIPMVFKDRRVGVVLINEQNPLLFNESTKHKLRNIVRLTALEIQARIGRKQDDWNLYTNEYEAFIPDIWENAIETELACIRKKQESYNTWVGFATVANLSEIRSRFRLEDLKCMQKDLVNALNPNNYGVTGLVGSHSDYVYLILIQSKEKETLDYWRQKINEKFNKPYILRNGKQIDNEIHTGFALLHKGNEDAYQVTRQARVKLAKNGKVGSS